MMAFIGGPSVPLCANRSAACPTDCCTCVPSGAAKAPASARRIEETLDQYRNRFHPSGRPAWRRLLEKDFGAGVQLLQTLQPFNEAAFAARVGARAAELCALSNRRSSFRDCWERAMRETSI
jgi:hypothetical protein